jgi:hypothetical protein
MDSTLQNAAARTGVQVCALKYCFSEAQSATSTGNVILLAVKDGKALRLYLHRSLKEQIFGPDLDYFAKLLKDLLKRVKGSPGEVFEQLSNLSVGPIITDSVQWIDAGQEDFSTSFHLYGEQTAFVDVI